MLVTKEQLKKILLDADIIDDTQIKRAEKITKTTGQDLDEVLIEKDFVADEHLGRLIAEELEMNFVNLRNEKIDKKVLSIIPEIVAEKQRVKIGRASCRERV